MRIALLCPTRERPNDVTRLVQSIITTVTDTSNVMIYLGVDVDDPTKEEIVNSTSIFPFIKIISIENNGKFLGLGKIWNIMASQCPDEIFAMIGDDMTFETKDWDIEILNEFKDNQLKLIHCNDGMRGSGNHFSNIAPLAVNSFIHRKYYDTTGYYAREEWKHGYHDNWLQDVFSMLNRISYRHDIMIRHLHVSNPSVQIPQDKTSINLGHAYVEISNPAQLYYDLRHIRIEEVNKLRSVL